MSNPLLRGRFVWHELMTTDTKSAADFFTRLVGWKTQPWDQDRSYTMFVKKSGPMAGLMVLPEEARKMGTPPSWITYIGTPNVDEAARQAEKLGGKIMKPPSDIPTIGRFAIIQDPQGAVFALFTPTRESSSDASPADGDFSWHELSTTDWRAALNFYQALFGWEKMDSIEMGPEAGTYQEYGMKGKMLGGMFAPKHRSGPPAWLPYIRVPDSKNAAATVKKLGGQIMNGPMEVPGGDWVAQGLDLQGAVFAVHSLKPAVTKKPAEPKTAKKRAVKKAVAKAKTSRRVRKTAVARRPGSKKKGGSRRRR